MNVKNKLNLERLPQPLQRRTAQHIFDALLVLDGLRSGPGEEKLGRFGEDVRRRVMIFDDRFEVFGVLNELDAVATFENRARSLVQKIETLRKTRAETFGAALEHLVVIAFHQKIDLLGAKRILHKTPTFLDRQAQRFFKVSEKDVFAQIRQIVFQDKMNVGANFILNGRPP